MRTCSYENKDSKRDMQNKRQTANTTEEKQQNIAGERERERKRLVPIASAEDDYEKWRKTSS